MTRIFLFHVLVVLSFATVAIAGKPVNRITEFEAADVIFGDSLDDVIRSDGQGPYLTGVDGFEAYSEYGRTESVGGGRLASLQLKDLVSGDPTIDPSGQVGIIGMRHLVHNHSTTDLETSFPAPGTTVDSSAENPQSVHFQLLGADGNEYLISVWDDTGAISISSYDLNLDNDSDVNVIEALPTLVWTLYVQTTETVVVGKGKKQTTEERATFTPVAEYSGMTLQMRFDLLGFRIPQFNQ